MEKFFLGIDDKLGAVQKRRQQFGGGKGKSWKKLPIDRSKKTPLTWGGEGGVKKPKKMPTSFMDGPIFNCYNNLIFIMYL